MVPLPAEVAAKFAVVYRSPYEYGDVNPAIFHSNLIDVGGALYSTSAGGGSGYGGTIFKVSTSGTESVLYSFQGGLLGFKGGAGDGAYPLASPIDVNGVLYGTTPSGGTGRCDAGCGTVYAVSTTGRERVLCNFKGATADGSDPQGSLIEVNGALFGTTFAGGASGHGTVFELKP